MVWYLRLVQLVRARQEKVTASIAPSAGFGVWLPLERALRHNMIDIFSERINTKFSFFCAMIHLECLNTQRLLIFWDSIQVEWEYFDKTIL